MGSVFCVGKRQFRFLVIYSHYYTFPFVDFSLGLLFLFCVILRSILRWFSVLCW